MHKKQLMGLLAAGIIVANVASPAYATLVTIGTATYAGNEYQLIYDVEDQLTWLDYRNTVATYPTSVVWADSLNTALTINLYEGYSAASWDNTAWRLPEASGYWYNNSSNAIYGSELADLYYDELGNVLNDTSLNFGPFENLTPNYHWLMPNFPISISYAPEFNFADGTTSFFTSSVNGSGMSGMAVRSGEVLPEPATICLLGLGGLFLSRRRP